MKLSLGTAQFGMNYGITNQEGKVSLAEMERILEKFRSAGMVELDSAIAYGSSESRLGKIGVNEFLVSTKLPSIPKEIGLASAWVDKHLFGSLERLRIKSIERLYFHNYDDIKNPNFSDVLEHLLIHVRDGLVKSIGVSVYSDDDLAMLDDFKSITAIQAPINILDQHILTKKVPCSIVDFIGRSIFLQGILVAPLNAIDANLLERFGEFFSAWDNYVSESDLTAIQICMAYVSQYEKFSQYVVGVTSVAELDEILLARSFAKTVLTDFSFIPEAELIDPRLWSKL